MYISQPSNMDDTVFLERYINVIKNCLSKLNNIDSFDIDGFWSYEKQINQITLQYASMSNSIEEIVQYLGKRSNLSAIEKEILLESPLPTILKNNLSNDSLLDISRNMAFYSRLIKLVEVLSKFNEMESLFLGRVGLWKAIQDLYYLSKKWTAVCSITNTDNEFLGDINQAYEILKLRYGNRRRQSNSIMASCPYHENLFRNRIRDLQIQEYDMIDPVTGIYNHSFHKEIINDSISNLKTRVLINEIGSMIETLPLSPSSSIFIGIDTNRIDVIKAIITGPDSTPYENGCFLFDIYFPSNYPNCPPKVRLMTTGHGRIRFNPNLYEDGEVCLSLLGTWAGSSNEVWSPQTSTLLQVLISIQSLIMNKKPFFNEPGYEIQIGTEEGEICSNEYNNVIRAATMRWALLDMMRHPPKGFEKVLLEYFRCKKYDIMDQCDLWTESTTSIPTAIHNEIMEELSQEKYNLD